MLLAGGMFLLKIVCFSGFLLGPRSYGGGCDDPASFGCWAGGLSVCVFVLQMPSRCVQLISGLGTPGTGTIRAHPTGSKGD